MKSPPTRSYTMLGGHNALVELEAIVVVGDGYFEIGVRTLLSIFARQSLVKSLGNYPGHLFGDLQDKRHWCEAVYTEDAAALRAIPGGPSTGLSTILTLAWSHLTENQRGRAARRMDELPLDEMAAARRAAKIDSRWTPPSRPLRQIHLVDWEDRSGLDTP